ncbi:hypothetical protein BV898_01485 [Hypsibius exemplaris]|uniref:G-protein coupled receptors family 1 profile domain-containing protein n=1 Tax=Hypsibius exemplaris TaxID=2072580 RepID=A0A1W0XBM1_HYPEX|nr:hypothetical protein BV898_01485 [Hypsibius exemplaris]
MNVSTSKNGTFAFDPYCVVQYNASAVRGFSPDPVVYSFQSISGAFCCFGVFANLLLLAVVLRSAQLRKGAGVVIAHLFIVQTVNCALILPTAIARVAAASVADGPMNCGFCRLQVVVQVAFNTIVNWSEALLAVNRLVAIFFPLHFNTFNRHSVQYAMLGLCWFSTAILTVPPAFGLLAGTKMTVLGTCAFVNRSAAFSGLLSFNAYCPLALVALAAVVIIGRITFRVDRFSTRASPHAIAAVPVNSPNNTVAVPSSMSERQKRTTKMLCMSFAFSLVCQLPLYLIPLTGLSVGFPELVLCFWILTTVQFAVTPVIFLIMNKDYTHSAEMLYARVRGQSVAPLLESTLN